jgi:hypothetical protein
LLKWLEMRLHRIREAQAAVAVLASGDRGGVPGRESLEQFLAKLPELWREGEALSRPICSNCSAYWASAASALAPLAKTCSAPTSSCFFQAWLKVGWMP